MNTNDSQGCESGHCACAALTPPPVARINGVALFEPGESPDLPTLRERAYAELLRQEAVKAGVLPHHTGLAAPELDEAQRQAVEALLDTVAVSPEPGESECRRYFEAHKSRFMVGQALHLRHILFAVTPGVNVQALAQRAEVALLELIRNDSSPGRFEQLAMELSNCPSSAQGGDLGWLTPHDCAPELTNALFFQTDSRWSVGVHPRLVHSRFGLHIMEVLDQREGKLPTFEAVQGRIRNQLALQSRSTALRQYMQLLVGQAHIEGLELEGTASPLVQ